MVNTVYVDDMTPVNTDQNPVTYLDRHLVYTAIVTHLTIANGYNLATNGLFLRPLRQMNTALRDLLRLVQ
jgi:hypothetical protein